MSTAPATCIRTLRLKVKSEAHSWLNAAAIEVHQDAGDFYRNSELQIAQLQRRGHKSQVERLHRKVARRRKDALHKFSRKIVNQYQNIVIGDVSSAKLIKTLMAKSVHDAGWYLLKTQLQYKSQQAGRSVEFVSERTTTRTCST